ncbi:hypothetical protein [Ekhidna sp.]|uniref:YtxH domain-containing protein n=1 Tax=Ekhidna sp. TaxID=2608089 RepID=UPI003CCC0A8A
MSIYCLGVNAFISTENYADYRFGDVVKHFIDYLSQADYKIPNLRILTVINLLLFVVDSLLFIGTIFLSVTSMNIKNYMTMKTIIQYSKITLKSLSILALIFMFACSSGESKDSNFEEQREEVVEDLEKMKSSVNDAIDDIEDKLNINEGPVERTLEEAKADLEMRREKLEDAIKQTKNATKENWNNVKTEVNDAMSEVKEGYQKIKNDVEKLFTES